MREIVVQHSSRATCMCCNLWVLETMMTDRRSCPRCPSITLTQSAAGTLCDSSITRASILIAGTKLRGWAAGHDCRSQPIAKSW